jgi:hypothetical protein
MIDMISKSLTITWIDSNAEVPHTNEAKVGGTVGKAPVVQVLLREKLQQLAYFIANK